MTTTHRLHATRHTNDLWVIYDPAVRQHVPLAEATELVGPGAIALRLFWCPQAGRHLPVPGATLHTINTDGTFTLQQD
jgi:hypothetical protein